MKRLTITLILCVTLAMLAGCSLHSTMNQGKTTLALPAAPESDEPLPIPEPWWESFNDTQLNAMMAEALNQNYTLRAAWSRLDQAHHLATIAGASRWPSLNLELTGSEIRYDDGTGPMGADTVETWQAAATVSWQLDIWQKIASSSRASALDAAATRSDLEATAHTIASSVADTWFALIAQRETLRLLSSQAQISGDYLELVEYRFNNGLASALEVYQQRSAVAAVEALVPESEASVTVLENTLNLLLGREPGTAIPAVLKLPVFPTEHQTSITSDRLRNRPDVRAAELRLIAADYRLAAAIADRLPSIGLSYTAGSQTPAFKDLLDDWFYNLAGNLLAPIFDAGRLKAESDRNRAVVEERFLGWESALLTAWSEVENHVAEETGLQRSLEHVDGQVALARITLERSRDQYLNGLVDYLNVLNSLQNLQQLERQHIRTRQGLLSNRVALYLALGGDWSRNLSRTNPVNNSESEVE